MIQSLIGPIANLAGSWMKNRAEKAQAKQKLEVAKIEAKTKDPYTQGEHISRNFPCALKMLKIKVL